MKKIIYALYLISLGSFGLKLDSRSHLTPGAGIEPELEVKGGSFIVSCVLPAHLLNN